MGASQPAQPRCARPRRPGNLPVGCVAAGNHGPDRSKGVAGDAARPRQVPQGSHHILVTQHRVHAAGDLRQLAEEVPAAIVLQMVQQPLLGVPGLIVSRGVQGEFGRVRQVQAHPAVIAGKRTGAGPEDLAGSHQLVQHGGLVVGHPAGKDERFPRRGRYRHAGELIHGRDDAVQPAQGGLAAAAARDPDVLPRRKEPPVCGRIHGLHFGTQCRQRPAAQFPQHLGVAPFAGAGQGHDGGCGLRGDAGIP